MAPQTDPHGVSPTAFLAPRHLPRRPSAAAGRRPRAEAPTVLIPRPRSRSPRLDPDARERAFRSARVTTPDGRRLADTGHGPAPRLGVTTVALLVPAHDEEEGIATTVEGLLAQRTPNWLQIVQIVVVANNCTDRTADLARRYPVRVIEMHDNPEKKSGALNHGWHTAVGDHVDLVMTMDADTVLTADTVAAMAREMRGDPTLGAVCARYWTTPGRGLVWRLQRLEYARYDDLRELRGWRVSVASGAAAMYRQEALRAVAADRSTAAGRVVGPWDGASLIEDYALTLDLRARGWRAAAARGAHVFTTPPATFRELWVQRQRWARGGMDECLKRGWTPATRKDVLSYGLFTASVFCRALFVAMVALMIIYHVPFQYALIGLIPVGVMWMERMTSMWHVADRCARDVAMVAVLLVEDCYGFFLELCAVVSACRCLRGSRQSW